MSEMYHSGPEHAFGYTPISSRDGEMLMDFGVHRLKKDDTLIDDSSLEKAYLLVYGQIEVTMHEQKKVLTRNNCFDTGPLAVHADQYTDIAIRALSEDSEVCLMRTDNEKTFIPKWYLPEDTQDEYRGAGLMNDTSTRIVRTIFDKNSAPDSKLVLGEVIGFPGKWSSYPPHHHPQPEIYYYKTNPSNGFAYAELGEKVLKVKQNDTVFIAPGLTHPHCTAPGYALWYLWVIRHLEKDPYITPIFVKEHEWVAKEGAKYWPERKGAL